MSRHVSGWLEEASRIEVLHATEKVINLATDSGRLVSLVTSAIGDGPHNIVLPLKRFEPTPSPDASEVIFDRQLTVDGYIINLVEANLWDPSPDWVAVRKHRHHIQRAAPGMLAVLNAQTPDPGVRRLFNDDPVPDTQLENHFIDAIKQPTRSLISGLGKGSIGEAMDGARELAGLGTGLTPAGDDLITGAMLACWAGFCHEQTLEKLPGMAAEVSARTTRLSAAYLQAAAEGEFGIVWHRLLDALTRADEKETSALLDSIMSIGHNSGAYTLAGFILLVGKPAAAD